MIQQFLNQSSWRYYELVIGPNETITHTFDDTNPNQFVIVNPNLAVLHVGIHTLPTNEKYEFKVEYNATETFGRPVGTKYIYITNTTGVKVNIQLFSLESPNFDLGILKNMNINLTDYTLQANSQISGVNAGVVLPTKDNELLSALNKVYNLLSGLNYTGDYDKSMNQTLLDIKEIVNTIKTNTSKTFLNKVNTFNHTQQNNDVFTFEYLFNDGEEATICKTNTAGVKTEILSLLSGEAIENFKIYLQAGEKITIESAAGSYRICHY